MLLKKPLVLASRSPRRLRLLRQIGLEPLVVPCDIAETFNLASPASVNAESLAVQKARTVAQTVQHGIVLGADTIVSLKGIMLGKPETPDEAVRMLGMLSGRTHLVHTGYALIDRPSDRMISGSVETAVTFREIPPDEIAAYVAGGSPMDKAGAYGIQDDYGAVFVPRIEGCFYNVVGLPLPAVYAALQKLQAEAPTGPERN